MNTKQITTLAGGVVTALLGTFLALAVNPPITPQSQASKGWVERVNPHLDWAERETEKCLAEQFADLARFFQAAKNGTPAFVEKALGWESKWNFVLDRAPIGKGGNHSAFIAKTLEGHVFSAQQLEQAIAHLITGYLDSLEAIENQLFVKIRQDVERLPGKLPDKFLDRAKFQTTFNQAMKQANMTVAPHVVRDIGKELLSLISGEVLTQGTVRLGVSSGVLTTGATTSLTTLGIGLAASIAADEVITWGWNQLADPKGKLSHQINAKIDEMHHALVEGKANQPGLRLQIERYAEERAKLRRQAILELGQKGADR